MTEPKLVFIEFTEPNGAKERFVGTLEGIKADTKNFTQFAEHSYASHRLATEAEFRALNLRYLDSGINCVRNGESESFFLGQPQGDNPKPERAQI